MDMGVSWSSPSHVVRDPTQPNLRENVKSDPTQPVMEQAATGGRGRVWGRGGDWELGNGKSDSSSLHDIHFYTYAHTTTGQEELCFRDVRPSVRASAEIVFDRLAVDL